MDSLIEAYFRSENWSNLRSTTKKGKRNRLNWIREKVGRFQYASLMPTHVLQMMSKKRGPNAANRLHTEISELFNFAKTNLGYTGSSPTDSVTRCKIKTKGYHTWTEAKVQAFRDYFPTGTLPRFAFELASNWRSTPRPA